MKKLVHASKSDNPYHDTPLSDMLGGKELIAKRKSIKKQIRDAERNNEDCEGLYNLLSEIEFDIQYLKQSYGQ